MQVRVNIATEYGGESYLVDTDDLTNHPDLKSALEFMLANPDFKGSTTFGDNLTVVYSELIQEGYEINEAVQEAEVKEAVPEIPVITNI